MTLGDRIKAAMREAGIKTNAELARRAGMTRQAIGQLINGDSGQPLSASLVSLAKALGQSEAWIANGKGKMNRYDGERLGFDFPAESSERLLKDLDKSQKIEAGATGPDYAPIGNVVDQIAGGDAMPHEGENRLTSLYRTMNVERKASLLRIAEDFATVTAHERANRPFDKRQAP